MQSLLLTAIYLFIFLALEQYLQFKTYSDAQRSRYANKPKKPVKRITRAPIKVKNINGDIDYI